ncbi:MAG: hypothetical protein VB108_11375 [Anaerolineaceae bacterium]|nr:hypothetical protein [Anaerolineaceae bacterium]
MSDLANIFGKIMELVKTNYLTLLALFIVYLLLWLLGKFGLAAIQEKLSLVLLQRFAGQRIPSEAKMKNMCQAIPLAWKEVMQATLLPIFSVPGSFRIFIKNKKSLERYFTPARLVSILQRIAEDSVKKR